MPQDSFADRLARVRRHQGWNYAEASMECGFPRQNWRLWEVGESQPSNMAQVVEKIHTRTGVDRMWLMWGNAAGAKTTGEYYDPYPHLGYLADECVSPDTSGLVPAA